MKLEAILWIMVLVMVALSLLFPRIRTFSLSMIAVAIVAAVAIIVVARRREPQTQGVTTQPNVETRPIDFERYHVDKLDVADPEAKSRIPVDKLRFDQVRADVGAERGSIGTVVARLYNDSAIYTLTDYGYYLVVQDCIKAACTTVFDQHGLAAVSVPPNQARDVQIAVRDASTRDVPPLKILGIANIHLTPTATRAVLAKSATND